jgi:4-hydroxybenzoate polyprenyltransferase
MTTRATPGQTRPLCVDLDGSLLATDLLHESLLSTLQRSPWLILACVVWAARGRAHLKNQLALRARLDVASLPYREEVVAFLGEERSRGRPIVLATASSVLLARQVADHLKIFDEVIASTDELNLKGRRKAAELTKRFGAGGFDYLGDSASDLPVWQAAERAHIVDRSGRLAPRVRRQAKVDRVFATGSATTRLTAMLGALRPHQWVKNLLVFVPLVAAHRLQDASLLAAAAVAFAAFCALASSAYLFNDLLDLGSDRAHPRKRQRPLASGRLSVLAGGAMSLLALAAGAALASALPIAFQLSLAAYFGLTLAYSLGLKKVPILDIVSLAGLYTLRIIGGGYAVTAPVSAWLLAFAVFLFFSLAMVKRYAELVSFAADGVASLPGRGYVVADTNLVLTAGASSAMMSVLVLALYTNGDSVAALYSNPDALWLLCPILLYWILRIWLLAARGGMHDDPVLFAVRDPISYLAAASGALVLWSAT